MALSFLASSGAQCSEPGTSEVGARQGQSKHTSSVSESPGQSKSEHGPAKDKEAQGSEEKKAKKSAWKIRFFHLGWPNRVVLREYKNYT